MKEISLFNIYNTAVLLAFLLYPSLALTQHKNEIEIREIASINEILEIVGDIRKNHPYDSIVAASDWDGTISLNEGEEQPLREENTARVFEKLVEEFEVDPIILTARYHGENFDELECDPAVFKKHVSETVKRMHAALPILKISSFPILRTGGNIAHFKIADENGSYTVMMQDGIIFAGSPALTPPIKGKVLRRFVERLPKKLIDHLLFIDNDYDNILSVKEAFKDHPEKHKIILLYYPNKTVRYSLGELITKKPYDLWDVPDLRKDELIKHGNLFNSEQLEAIWVR